MRDAELSYLSINLAIIAICHFFKINDISINKKKIGRFKGENINKFEYRAYTHQEIAKLLAALNERDRAAILLMASTGMRVGALPDLKITHQKMGIGQSSYYIYQITVYDNSPKDRYITFCTPEAAKAIDDYLELRKRFGGSLESDSYLFIRIFNKDDTFRTITDKRALRSDNLMRIIIKVLAASGLRKINKIPKNLEYSKRSLSSMIKHELHP